jgi:hypothetical protein
MTFRHVRLDRGFRELQLVRDHLVLPALADQFEHGELLRGQVPEPLQNKAFLG